MSLSCEPFEDNIIKYDSILFCYLTLHQFYLSLHLGPRCQILSFVSVSSICVLKRKPIKKASRSSPCLSVEELQTGSPWHDIKSDCFWLNLSMCDSQIVLLSNTGRMKEPFLAELLHLIPWRKEKYFHWGSCSVYGEQSLHKQASRNGVESTLSYRTWVAAASQHRAPFSLFLALPPSLAVTHD